VVQGREAVPQDEIASPVLERGHVWLVGAGPGDPELLTLRAAGALRLADIVYHDTLPGPGVLALAGRQARLIDVGKRKGLTPCTQAWISAALVEAALRGERVVRLKGGDPLLFGRAAEELTALSAAGIPWRIVPGVSSATAAPAAAGISLTMRGIARSVTYITCHDKDGRLPDNVETLARALSDAGDSTLVAFMGLSRLDELSIRLLAGGFGPETPVAIVGRASLPGETVLRTTLGGATLAAKRASVPSPALVIVGAVAAEGHAHLARTIAAAPLPAALTPSQSGL
jgi:uroporphyrin-III C-methyltransferase